MVDLQLNTSGKTILAGRSTGTVRSSFWDDYFEDPHITTKPIILRN